MRPMPASRLFLLLLSLFLAPLFTQSAHADATIQYKIELKPGAMIPASMLQQNGLSQKVGQPITSIIQLKGNQEYISAGGNASAGQTPLLLNFDTKEVTFIDPVGKRYTIGRLDDLIAQVNAAASSASGSSSSPSSAIPPAAKAIIQQIRLNFSSQKTGRTDLILGVPVAENVWTLTLDMPASALPLPGMTPVGNQITLAKIVVHVWIVDPKDVARNSALTEFSSRGSSFKYLYDPSTVFKSLSDYPALQDSLSSLFTRYMNKRQTVLKLDADMYLPVLAQMAPLLQAGGKKLPEGFDANASLMNISMETTQISATSIDSSVFKVPAGYTSVPLDQVLRGAMKPAMPAPSATGSPSAQPAAPGSAAASAAAQSASDKAARAAAVMRGDQH